ncbi:MAG: hypothetical protein ACREEJ_21625, partial [Ensifer adhaerens]
QCRLQGARQADPRHANREIAQHVISHARRPHGRLGMGQTWQFSASHAVGTWKRPLVPVGQQQANDNERQEHREDEAHVAVLCNRPINIALSR